MGDVNIQPHVGPGRPPGSKNLHSKDASRRLAQLGFDPIEEMIKLHAETIKAIAKESSKEKPSAMALSQLMNVKQKCINDLMRYGYARTSESTEIKHNNLPPMTVVMTPAGYKPGDAIPSMINGIAISQPGEDPSNMIDGFDELAEILDDMPMKGPDE